MKKANMIAVICTAAFLALGCVIGVITYVRKGAGRHSGNLTNEPATGE